MSQIAIRRKGVRPTKVVTSPHDEHAQFTIAKATNREDVVRQNMYSKVRMVLNSNTPDEITQERDVPMGDVQVDTILLCLEGWTLGDENGIYPITKDNVLDYLKAAERVWLYREVMDLNPLWKGEEEKPESE